MSADSDFDVFLMTKSSLSFAKLNIYIRALLLNHARSLSPSSFHKTKSKSLFVVKNSRVCWLGVKDDASNTKNKVRV